MGTEKPNTRQGRTFDWESVYQSIAQIGVALRGLDETTPEVMEQIWARRATRLAQVGAQEDEGERLTLVLVRLGRELYAFEAQYALDNRPVEQITPVPRVPGWVVGVTNVRGRILSVLDLRRFFGLPAAEESKDDSAMSYLVVVETPDLALALQVDEILTVESLPTNWLQDSTDAVRALPAEYVRGLIERRENGSTATVVVLDLPALLADGRLIVHEEIV